MRHGSRPPRRSESRRGNPVTSVVRPPLHRLSRPIDSSRARAGARSGPGPGQQSHCAGPRRGLNDCLPGSTNPIALIGRVLEDKARAVRPTTASRQAHDADSMIACSWLTNPTEPLRCVVLWLQATSRRDNARTTVRAQRTRAERRREPPISFMGDLIYRGRDNARTTVRASANCQTCP